MYAVRETIQTALCGTLIATPVTCTLEAYTIMSGRS